MTASAAPAGPSTARADTIPAHASRPAPSAKPSASRRRARRRETLAAYLFISPWILGFLVFTVISMGYSLLLSFTDYDLATDAATYVGTDNYRALIEDPRVLLALGNTFTYALMAVPLETCVALLIALLLHSVRRGSGFFRVVYYLPKMTPVVATAAVFLLLLNGNQGAINQFLGLFGIPGPQWLIDPAWVKPSIVLMSAWGVAGSAVILLAALKAVPVELYEAAALDGAGPLRRLWSITLPMISPTLFFIVITLTIASLQVFDQAYLLFYRDGAGTTDAALFYGVYLYQQAFQQFNFGLAASMAWVLFVIIMLITLVQLTVGRRLVHDESGAL